MPSVLVVEDEVALRYAIRWQIRNFLPTAEVHLTNGLREVKANLEDDAPLDAAVVDLRLGDNGAVDNDGGFRVIDYLADHHPKTPVIVLSVRNDHAAWHKAKVAPNVPYFITKPWSSEQLEKAVECCVNGDATGFTAIGVIERAEP